MKHIIDYLLEGLRINKDTKLEKSDPEDPGTWSVGDILSGTYSYSMTIPYFYRIIKRTNKAFTLQKLPKKLASGHYNGQFSEVPDENKEPTSKPVNTRINKYGHVVVDRVYLRLWDGKPVDGDDMD